MKHPKPLPPLPVLILETFSQKFFALPNGQVQIISNGERPQTITRAAFDRIYNVLNP